MTIEELKQKFAQLNGMLSLPNCTEKEEKEKENEMREILKERCKIQSFTADNIIDSMNRQALIELNGTLDKIHGQEKRDKINKEARETQIKQDKYSKDNPYPNNKDKH